MSAERCETCRYYAPDTNYICPPLHPRTLCHRWPAAEWKAPTHWCGEHKPRQEAAHWLEREP